MDELQTDDVGAEVQEEVSSTPEQQSQTQGQDQPAPVSEPEPISPDWLSDAGAPVQEEPVMQPRQEWQQQVPGQVQQPQPQQSLGTDVDAYIDQRAQQIAQKMFEDRLGPVAYQLQQMDARTNQFVQSQADVAIAQAKDSVSRAYRDVFSKDEAFRGNEAVRGQVEGTLRGMLEQAAHAARVGNPQQLSMFNHPKFYQTFLAAAKVYADWQPGASAPMQPAGAQVEPVTPTKAESAIKLPPDLEEIARRGGDAKRKELEAAYAETVKRGDLEMND